MATSDIDLSIRVAVIRVLGDIESHFPLEEEEKEKLCFLLFDEEPRVRRAVSSFVKTVWEEEVDEKLGSLRKPSEKDKERIGIKVLAELLVKWGKALDSISGDAADSEIGDEEIETGEGSNGRRQSKQRKELIALVAAEDRGRISMAVEALWDEVTSVSDWENLLELLLLDHSAEDGVSHVGPARGRPRMNGKSHKDDFHVDETWRLEEAEETALLEVIVAAIRMAKEESTGGKKVSNSM
jgi:cohesin complex subunit SA-1/2